MKSIVSMVTLLVALTASTSFADWLESFRSIFERLGIDNAVEEALKQGATPDGIMENGLKFESLNPQNLVKAMYCSGIRGDDIRASGQKFDVSDVVIVAGYQKSVEECGDAVVDTQAYTPVATVNFSGPPSVSNGTNASPSTQ